MAKSRLISYQELMARYYPDDERAARVVTFQVTEACNLSCSYCYQTCKSSKRMSFNTAKRLMDYLLSDQSDYINTKNTLAVILDFIGGEPLLEIDLIDQICDYWLARCIELEHPWAYHYQISMCSNGVLYFDERVQAFLCKHHGHVGFSISIDGDERLHDSCRVFPDGSGSYGIASRAAEHYMENFGELGSKITICPENLPYLSQAIQYFVNMGYRDINANCVFENVWDISHARLFYHQMKRLADYLLDGDLYKEVDCSLLHERFFRAIDPDNNQNWCGGTGAMLACDPDGNLYPCLRYMPSSLGGQQEPYIIGTVDTGIGDTACHRDCIACLNAVTRRSQSTDECFGCPIAAGCAWCSAYNYQVFGTPDKRATFICDMHKARALANVYYWNRVYQKRGEAKVMENHCPREWALEIITREELKMLDVLVEQNRKELQR
jgi:uncharacterized protein